MTVVRAVSRSSLALIPAALIIAAAISFTMLYTARGDTPNQTFYACLFAGSITQVNTAGPPACGRGTAIQWNAQGEQGIQGEQGEQGLQGEQGVQGPEGPAGADAPKQIAGMITGEGDIFTPGGRGFTPSRLDRGHYKVTFPAGTWDPESFPIPVVTPFDLNPAHNVTGVVSRIALGQDGSYEFEVRFDDADGAPVNTLWFFVVTQS